MVSLMPMACIAEDLTEVARAEAVIAAAGDHLALPPADLPPTALGCQLDDLRQRLEQRIALSPEPTDDSKATSELLISILRAQCELLDHDLSRRVRCLTEIRNALGEL
ncbi:MAG: response regulator containing a CheY-like receiver domain and an DNA-binding domain, partial [Mycobacterium sp.]|nr:response regulator containing a CheY-like receiver domain and an DNA-binding domain [Mycobacterium sp.]